MAYKWFADGFDDPTDFGTLKRRSSDMCSPFDGAKVPMHFAWLNVW